MDLSPKLNKDLDDVAVMVASVNWYNWAIDGQGACIPIAYAISEFLALRNRPSRVAETTMVAQDSANIQRLEIEPAATWLGHVVTLLPTHGLLLDGSLWTQRSKVLANFDIPKLLIVPWSRGMGATGTMGRLTIQYQPDLKAKSWARRNWPWADFRRIMKEIDQDMKELDA